MDLMLIRLQNRDGKERGNPLFNGSVSTNESVPKARALVFRADSSSPFRPVCTIAVVATATAIASAASEARSGLRRSVDTASANPSMKTVGVETRIL